MKSLFGALLLFIFFILLLPLMVAIELTKKNKEHRWRLIKLVYWHLFCSEDNDESTKRKR